LSEQLESDLHRTGMAFDTHAAVSVQFTSISYRKMVIKRILVPVDFSDLSTKALEIAQKFARLFDATITPVHIHIPITEMDEP
jgi:hypothetical protein